MDIKEIENRILELGKSIEKCQLEAIELNKQWWNLKQMQPKEKTYTWEDCFQGGGYYKEGYVIEKTSTTHLQPVKLHHNVATTEKLIRSNDAACQLSHIIEAINKDFEDSGDFGYALFFQGTLNWSNVIDWSLPRLNSDAAAECLIKHHAPLLKQYFGVE